MRRLLSLVVFGGLLALQGLPVAYAADGDGDLIDDAVDVCPTVADPFQGDLDGDGIGDLCEPGSAGVNSFAGTSGNDLVFGTDEADTLSGAAGNDALYGEGGDDTLKGGSGQDFLVGGPGTDTLTGGSGCDMFAVSPSGDDDVITDFNPELDRLLFPGHDDDPSDDGLPATTFGGDSHLVVTFEDQASTSTSFLEFEGLPPDEPIVLLGGPCSTPPKDKPQEIPEVVPPEEPSPPFVCSPMFPDMEPGFNEIFGITFPLDGILLNGTEANETLNGTHCSDQIAGDGGFIAPENQGPDTEGPSMEPPGCATEVCSDDLIYADDGNDIVLGDSPFLIGTQVGGNDTIYAGGGDDLVVGDADVILNCDCGVDALPGGPIGGDDTIFGEDGDDVLIGDALDAVVGEGSFGGNDTIDGGNGDDLILGDADTLAIGATGGNDALVGGAGNDFIYGDAFEIDEGSTGGNDTLTGGAGNDILFGDAEILDGVAGSDTFVFSAASNFGDDTIVDLGIGAAEDTISFSGPGLTTIADLDARSTVGEVAGDVIAAVYTDSGKTTISGNITMIGIGTGSISSWADIDALASVEVVIV